MTTGSLHPADEKALSDIFDLAREVAARLSPGRRSEIIIERTRGGRITGRVTETHYLFDQVTHTGQVDE